MQNRIDIVFFTAANDSLIESCIVLSALPWFEIKVNKLSRLEKIHRTEIAHSFFFVLFLIFLPLRFGLAAKTAPNNKTNNRIDGRMKSQMREIWILNGKFFSRPRFRIYEIKFPVIIFWGKIGNISGMTVCIVWLYYANIEEKRHHKSCIDMEWNGNWMLLAYLQNELLLIQV